MVTKSTNKIANVPNLRFPFDDVWEKYRVSDLLEFFTTNSLSWEQLEYDTDNLYNLHYGLIHKGASTQISIDNFRLPNIRKKFIPQTYILCKDGDVAFADASEDTNDVAKVVEFFNCNDKKIVCGLHTIHGRDKLNITIKGFKGYAFSSFSFRNQIKQLAQGTKVYSVSQKNFSECFIGIPSKEEQTKIAHLLQLIDDHLSTQSQIIQRLKSLIQNLNNNLKELYGNKIEISLQQLGSSYSGLSGKSAEDFGSGKPFATYMNVYKNMIVDESMVEYVKIDKNETQNKVQYGDVLFTISSETPQEVGISAVYLGNNKELYLNSFCFGYRLDNFDTLLPEYMPYLFSCKQFRKIVCPLAQGSTRFNLQKTDFLRKKFKIPTTQNQKKISNVLNAFSEKLKIEQKLLFEYQNQKKYLLNQMFI